MDYQPAPSLPTEEGKRSNTVLSVVKALQILETLADANQGLALGELSRRTDLHPSTAHRLLHTLLEAGYVRQAPHDRNYHLAAGAMNLAHAAARHTDVRAISLPFLRQLADTTDETVSLVIREGTEIVYIAQAESTNTVRTFTSIGARSPLYCTAGGKMLLSLLPGPEQDVLLTQINFVRRTSNTLTDADMLRVELERIRRRGYAVDDEEYEWGMRCVAAAIQNHTGDAVAAVIISGPSTRISISRLTDLAQQVQQCVVEISSAMGFA